MSLADYVLDLIRHDLRLPSRREWLERLATREPVDISREEIPSALVELLIQSERAPAVLQAVGTTDMVAPDGINAEVLSALRRFERTGKLPAKRASQAVEDRWTPTCGGSRHSRCCQPYGSCGPTSPPMTPATSPWPAISGAPWSPAICGCRGRPSWACRW
jgi:hypothetical protein